MRERALSPRWSGLSPKKGSLMLKYKEEEKMR
jgi:hypothetical protein